VLRLIPTRILTFDEIGLPAMVQALCRRPRGLFLITGPTGSGKTTTLATMIDYINRNFDRHIITVEDPIEYYHKHDKSLISQREVGVDVPSFAEALRRCLRMDPDVVLVGEMRDLETMESAIRAAETGHLVFATVHTTGAQGTINRIIDAFPVSQQEQIRVQLSVTLIAVLSQVLLPRATSGRIAAYEFLLVTPAISNLIRENKTYRIDSSIQTGKKYGMQLLDDHLWKLYDDETCAGDECLERARFPADFQSKMDDKARGQAGPGGLMARHDALEKEARQAEKEKE
jgi:twitching motility protein PilT